MSQILVLDSTNQDIFFCGLCKQVYNSLTLFLAHKNNECKNYSVELPDSTASKKISTHEIDKSVQSLPTMDQNDDLSCRICKKIFKKSKSLHSHIKVHEKPFQCAICGRCFVQNSHLQRHIQTHKVWPDGISETTAKTTEVDLLSYTCLYCDLTVTTYTEFRVHLKRHMCIKKFKCIQNQCNSFYETLESLMHHVSSFHKTVNYKCHNCNKIFYSLMEIAIHYQSYNNRCVHSLPKTEIFKCSQCDAIFKKAEKLSLHMLTESHKKCCIHCNKIFSSDKRLRLHLQVHRKCKPYQCNICGESFHMKKYLSSHLLKHKEKKYECKVCKSLFKRQDSLHRHMKSHQIRKMYKCPFTDTLNCKKEFTRSDKLKSHIRFHTKKMAGLSNKKEDTVEICIVPLKDKKK